MVIYICMLEGHWNWECIGRAKIQETKMLIMCQLFGDLFLIFVTGILVCCIFGQGNHLLPFPQIGPSGKHDLILNSFCD